MMWWKRLFKERVGACLAVLIGLGALIALTAPALAARGHDVGARLLIGAFVGLLVGYLVGYLVFNIFRG